MMHRTIVSLCFLAAVLVTATDALAATNPPADLVVTNARIYTVSPQHAYAEALAVRDGKIVFVGSRTAAAEWTGPGTKTVDLQGKLVLPGLVDAHIHPAGIVDLDVCSLDSRAVSLDELPVFVRGCIDKYKIPVGQWVTVQQWNFTDGNQPSAANPTLRAALDHASTDRPIELLGNDGHHGAFNSAGLALAKNDKGAVVGYSRASLK